MERRGFAIPLLIGGATTSRTHTAVKIQPAYRRGSTTYVQDASRAVSVVSGLLSPTERERNEAATRDEYVRIREQFARGQETKSRASLADARAARYAIDWSSLRSAQGRAFLGVRSSSDPTTSPISPGTSTGRRSSPAGSWLAVFPPSSTTTWSARRPATSTPTRKWMLKQIIAENWFTARGVVGFWPANGVGDDIVLYKDDERSEEAARLFTLRQQMAKSEGKANLALADFIAPVGTKPDYIGAFAVTAGHGEGEVAARFKAARRRLFRDPRGLAGRPPGGGFRRGAASPCAHRTLGLRARRAVRYRRPGRRGLSRHPAGARLSGPSRDHTEKATLFRLLDAEANTGMALTESFRHDPGRRRSPASISPIRRRTTSPGVGKIGPGPGSGLRPPQGLGPCRRRTLARADPELRPVPGARDAAACGRGQPLRSPSQYTILSSRRSEGGDPGPRGFL